MLVREDHIPGASQYPTEGWIRASPLLGTHIVGSCSSGGMVARTALSFLGSVGEQPVKIVQIDFFG